MYSYRSVIKTEFNFYYKLSIVFGRNGITMGYVRQNVEEELEISIELKEQLNNLEEYAMDNLTEQIFVKNVLV